MDFIGQVIGDRYRIEKQLGKKAGRRTMLATDQQTSERVVLKLLSFSPDFEWADLRLFEREAETLQSLTHPAIPQYLHHFELDTPELKGFVLVQSYIEAVSLEDHLKAGRTFSEADLKEIAAALLKILIYLHDRQPPVIHRDIKPSNVLLSDRSGNSVGQIYLVDFGSVQTLAAREGGTITIVGTYGYMPPEQFGGRAVPASDLYSLGATLVYLASGRHPADLPQTDLKLEFETAVSLSFPMVRWLKQMTEPSLNRRFASAQAALESLDQPLRDGALLPLLKPAGSRVLLKKDSESLEIVLPPAGWSAEIGFLIPFAIAWNALLVIFVRVAAGLGSFILLFLLPFWTAGAFMISKILVALFQRTHLRVTPESFSLSYEMLGIEYSPRSPIPNESIHQLLRQEHSGWEKGHLSPGIVIRAGIQNFELGRHLTTLETEWLAQELSEWLQLPVTPE